MVTCATVIHYSGPAEKFQHDVSSLSKAETHVASLLRGGCGKEGRGGGGYGISECNMVLEKQRLIVTNIDASEIASAIRRETYVNIDLQMDCTNTCSAVHLKKHW